jgi:hypothetical protein
VLFVREAVDNEQGRPVHRMWLRRAAERGLSIPALERSLESQLRRRGLE